MRHREKPIAELCLWTTVKQLIFSGSGEKIWNGKPSELVFLSDTGMRRLKDLMGQRPG